MGTSLLTEVIILQIVKQMAVMEEMVPTRLLIEITGLEIEVVEVLHLLAHQVLMKAIPKAAEAAGIVHLLMLILW